MFVRKSKLVAAEQRIIELSLQLTTETMQRESMTSMRRQYQTEVNNLNMQNIQLHTRLGMLNVRYDNLMNAYTELRKNQLTGESTNSGTFTDEQLKSLLQLVHPDKHGGKESAIAMTQLINGLRQKGK